MAKFAWPPGVSITPPASNSNDLAIPTSLRDLAFTPQGVYDLRRKLGIAVSPAEYMENQERFDAADVVWFASGCASDGRHLVNPREFHPTMAHMYLAKFGPESRRILREKTQHLVFDAATLWDRAFGGSTLVIHVDPTTAPGTPSAPQHLRAHVYIPPSTVVAELPAAHQPIADIVQSFIEHVGVPTKIRWEDAGQRFFGWTPEQMKVNNNRVALPRFATPIPSPHRFGSSVYIFNGYLRATPSAARRALPAPQASVSARNTAQNAPPPASAHSPPQPVSPDSDNSMYVDNHAETDASTTANITLTEISDTESDIEYDNEISGSFLAAVDVTEWAAERRAFEAKERDYLAEISALKANVSRLEGELSAARRPRTPAVDVSVSSLRSPFSPRKQPKIPAPSPAPPRLAETRSSDASVISGLDAQSAFMRMGNPSKKSDDTLTHYGIPGTLSKKKIGAISKPLTSTPISARTAPISGSPSAPLLSTFATNLGNISRPGDFFPPPPRPAILAPSVASRVSILLESLGYSESVVAGAHMVKKYVNSPFWAVELSSQFSVREEDMNDIISAMLEDV